MKYITVTLNPTVDRMYTLPSALKTGTLNRTLKMSEVSYSGKGVNVSRELKSLGVSSDMLCILRGSDGENAEKSFIEEGLTPYSVKAGGTLRNNISFIDPDGCDTEVNEPGEPVSFDDIVRFLSLYDNLIGTRDRKTVVISGSTPPGFRDDIYKMLIVNAKKNKAYTVLDADGELLKFGLEASPDLIKPNEHEIERLTGYKLTGNDEKIRISALAASSVIFDKTGSEVLCTLGSKGSVFVGKEGHFVCPARNAKIKRFKGAGDMYLARFLYERFEKHRNVFDAMKTASDETAKKLEK